ncbi:unnamed protein product [Schistosoma turkestanicum]|nr:unnamed protein product [Schistosoma turkestanicum]
MEIHSKNLTTQKNDTECSIYCHTLKTSSQMKEKHFNQAYTTINLNDANLDLSFDLTHSKCLNETISNSYFNNMNQLFAQIINPQFRKNALINICKSIEENTLDIGGLIDSRPGIMAALILEIVQRYPIDKSRPLSSESYEIICSIIVIFQHIILNSKFRRNFVSTGVLAYLLPYFNIESQTRNSEHLRVSLLGLYATMASKLSVDDMESILFPESNAYFNEETENEGRLDKIDNEANFNQYNICALNDLFTQTLKALIQCTTEVGKNMALILLARLLNSKHQRTRLYHNHSLFNWLISCLTQVTGYMVKRFTVDIQQQFVHETHLCEKYARATLMKAKRLLQVTMECFNQLIIDLRLRNRLRDSLPIELRSNIFSVILLHDQDVQLWLEKIWFQLGWNKMN